MLTSDCYGWCRLFLVRDLDVRRSFDNWRKMLGLDKALRLREDGTVEGETLEIGIESEGKGGGEGEGKGRGDGEGEGEGKGKWKRQWFRQRLWLWIGLQPGSCARQRRCLASFLILKISSTLPSRPAMRPGGHLQMGKGLGRNIRRGSSPEKGKVASPAEAHRNDRARRAKVRKVHLFGEI